MCAHGEEQHLQEKALKGKVYEESSIHFKIEMGAEETRHKKKIINLLLHNGIINKDFTVHRRFE